MEQVLGWMQLMLWIVRYYVDDNNTLLCIYALRTPHHLIFSDMEKMMTHWHRLLQITGGDLCLEKCKVSVLTWHYNNCWGLPTACTKQECQGDIIMVSALDPFQKHEKLDRIESWTGKRILGVKLAITGTMDDELKKRKAQTKKMA